MRKRTFAGKMISAWLLIFIVGLILTGGLVFAGSPAWASSNIVPGSKFSWSENAGWTNWSPTTGGAWVAGKGLVGYLWLENIGWIKLGSDGGPPYANTSATDWGVNNDEHGNLIGYAWSETTGWINFSPGTSRATIDAHGNFSGYAWGGLQVDSEFRIANVMNFPNPFGEAGTNLSYQLTQPADVTIKIFTVRGQLIKTFTASRGAEGGLAGFNKLPWDGRDSSGALIPNGVYLYLISGTSTDGKTAGARGKLASHK